MKISDDQSIFAWGLPEHSTTADEFVKCYTFPAVSELRGMFADAPSDFTFTHRIKVLENILSSMPPIVSNNRVEVELQVARWKENPLQVVALFCTTITDFRWFIWTPLLPWGKRWSARFAELVLIYPHSLMGGNLESSYGELSVCLISQLPKTYEISGPFQIIARTNLLIKDFYSFDEVKYAPRAICIPETKATTVMPSPELCVDSIHTVLFFKAHAHDNNLLRLLRYFSSTSVTKYKLEKYTFAVAGKKKFLHLRKYHFVIQITRLRDTYWRRSDTAMVRLCSFSR